MSLSFLGTSYYRTAFGTAPNVLPTCASAKTVMFKAYVTSLNAVQGLFNATNATSVAYQIGIASSVLRVWQFGGSNVVSATPPINQWIDIAYSYDGLTNRLYINGVQVNSSITGILDGAVTEVQIGGNQWNEYALNGVSIEDVRVYNRALSANEILETHHANNKIINVAGLVAWWPFILNEKEQHGYTTLLVGSGTPQAYDIQSMVHAGGYFN